MSALLFIGGVIALVVGLGMIGFGIPVNEFSFGNTLIMAGTTAAVGGLVVFGLGAVVMHLQRLGESLAMWTPTQPGRMAEMFEAPAAPHAMPSGGPRPPFPPRPMPKVAAEAAPAPVVEPDAQFEAPPVERLVQESTQESTQESIRALVQEPFQAPAQESIEDRFAAAPILHNPDVPPVETGEEVSLSPGQPQAAAPEPAWRPSPPPPDVAPAPAAPTETSHFDAMWPEFEPRSARKPADDDGRADPMLDLPPPRMAEALMEPDAADEAEPPRAVAILKSGVVDGMGYTLYVDGSIEAELPQGTLRFSSINDLRSYLEKNA
jgi:hypothetical protein